MRRISNWLLVLTLLGLLPALGACGTTPAVTPTTARESPLPTSTPGVSGGTLTVMTHDSFDVSEEIVATFQAQCGCQVQFLKSGDAGLMLNQAILSKDNPLADVIYGVDNTFLSRALEGDILEPYQSPVLADIPDSLKLDPTFRMSPVDYGDVCLNYDKAWFKEKGLAPPTDLPDLIECQVQGLDGSGEPGHFVAGPGLSAGHHRALWRGRAATPIWTTGPT